MERKILTWGDLANNISQMSPSERNERVKVWGEESPLCDDVILTKENEDICYDEDCPSDGCNVRSNFDEDSHLRVALEAGIYYLMY